MKKIYKDCELEVEEVEESLFEMRIVDKKSNIIILESEVESEEEYEESLLDKLKLMVNEYKKQPEAFLEYGIQMTK